MKPHVCVDCLALPEEPADLSPGEEVLYGPEFRPKTPRKIAEDCTPLRPRCATHKRAHKHAERLKARVKRSQKVYGLAPEDRADLMALQGGKCPICNRALDQDSRGRWNATAHDHDHELAAQHDHPVNEACPDCMRGLTCAWCNRELLARVDLEAARRLVAYYENPPMARMRAARRRAA